MGDGDISAGQFSELLVRMQKGILTVPEPLAVAWLQNPPQFKPNCTTTNIIRHALLLDPEELFDYLQAYRPSVERLTRLKGALLLELGMTWTCGCLEHRQAEHQAAAFLDLSPIIQVNLLRKLGVDVAINVSRDEIDLTDHFQLNLFSRQYYHHYGPCTFLEDLRRIRAQNTDLLVRIDGRIENEWLEDKSVRTHLSLVEILDIFIDWVIWATLCNRRPLHALIDDVYESHEVKDLWCKRLFVFSSGTPLANAKHTAEVAIEKTLAKPNGPQYRLLIQSSAEELSFHGSEPYVGMGRAHFERLGYLPLTDKRYLAAITQNQTPQEA